MSSAVISRSRSSTACSPRNRRSSASHCRGCPKARLECPARSPARCRSTRSGRVRRRSMRPYSRVRGNACRTAAMMRLSAQPIRHRLLITATTAASAVLLLFLGFEYGSQILSHVKAVRQPAPATGSTDTVPASRLELSVFDQPRGLPEIRFQDDQGHDLTLGDVLGRVVLTKDWATGRLACLKVVAELY